MNNLELFNLAAGAILGGLVDSLPMPSDINPNRLAATIAPDDFTIEQHVIFVGLVEHAGHWLKDEGYIRQSKQAYHSLAGPALQGVVLTEKALAVLGQIPDALQQQTSLGETLRKGVAEGSRTLIADAFKYVVTAGAALVAGT